MGRISPQKSRYTARSAGLDRFRKEARNHACSGTEHADYRRTGISPPSLGKPICLKHGRPASGHTNVPASGSSSSTRPAGNNRKDNDRKACGKNVCEQEKHEGIETVYAGSPLFQATRGFSPRPLIVRFVYDIIVFHPLSALSTRAPGDSFHQ